MERVTFILEDGDDRISCLMNPECLTWRRTAGIRPRNSLSGAVSLEGYADDAWLFTGGGRTEIDFELLFDVQIEGSSMDASDVRELTAPFSELAENIKNQAGDIRIPAVRFVWGKNWNIPGIISHVAERLERFTQDGAPQRSWLTMRFIRVTENLKRFQSFQIGASSAVAADTYAKGQPDGDVVTYRINEGDRIDLVAEQFLGSSSKWRIIADENDLANPLDIGEGSLLRIPGIA
jgi:hypothetical protein